MGAKCNLCDSENANILYRKKGKNTGIMHTIVKCKECNLVFVSTRLPEDTIQGGRVGHIILDRDAALELYSERDWEIAEYLVSRGEKQDK